MNATKILGITMAVSALTCSAAFAAPAITIQAGHGTVGVNYNLAPNHTADVGHAGMSDGDSQKKLGADIRVGIAKNVALQYRYTQGATDNVTATYKTYIIPNMEYTTRSQEYNVYYQVAPGASVYVGFVNNYADISVKEFSANDSSNTWQVGAEYVAKLAPKTNGWINAGVGGNSTFHAEAGVGYEVAKNLDVNLSYRYSKFDIEDNTFNNNGLLFGISYNF